MNCGHCLFWHPSVHKQGATWYGSCAAGNYKGDRHHSGYHACARFSSSQPERYGRGRFPFHGPPVRDGCEWNPEINGPAVYGDEHNASARADVLVGADGKWRLCASCAGLTTFGRFRRRLPIASSTCAPAASPEPAGSDGE